MDEEKKEQGKKCFIITPIGNENSSIFRKAKGVIESVIKPVLEENGFNDIKPAYEIMESGMISNQIIGRIINDDLIVANLTGNNPNVMYELAIRHGAAKPIIHICEDGTSLPFDIKDNRTIFYKDDMLGVQELKRNFEDFVKQVDYSKEYKDNPIYNGIKIENLFKKMDDEGKKNEVELLRQILEIISSNKYSFVPRGYNDFSYIENIIIREFGNKYTLTASEISSEVYCLYCLQLIANFNVNISSFDLGNVKFDINGKSIIAGFGTLAEIKIGLWKIYNDSMKLNISFK